MNEDYSELIKKFSNILSEKNIDLNSVLKDSNCNNEDVQKEEINNTSFDIGFEEIMKIKSFIDKMNNEENSNRNQLLHSLKPFLPTPKKEKLEQLIKLSSLLTALELLEHKNILGFDLNSNSIIIIILILIIL